MCEHCFYCMNELRGKWRIRRLPGKKKKKKKEQQTWRANRPRISTPISQVQPLTLTKPPVWGGCNAESSDLRERFQFFFYFKKHQWLKPLYPKQYKPKNLTYMNRHFEQISDSSTTTTQLVMTPCGPASKPLIFSHISSMVTLS